MVTTKNTINGWFEFEKLQQLVFNPSKALNENDSREIVAGVETDRLSLELNVQGVTREYQQQTGDIAYLEYFVCECHHGEWSSVADLQEFVRNLPYQGVISPTFNSSSTEQELKEEMTKILMELMQLTA